VFLFPFRDNRDEQVHHVTRDFCTYETREAIHSLTFSLRPTYVMPSLKIGVAMAQMWAKLKTMEGHICQLGVFYVAILSFVGT